MTCDAAVAVIDDDPKICDSLQLLLSTANVPARAYRSAEDFLAEQGLPAPRCLLLDVTLPGMSGLELLQTLQRDPHGCRIIMITGHGDVPMAVAAMRAGAFHFVEKPFDAEALLALVEEALVQIGRNADRQTSLSMLSARRRSLTRREQQVFDLIVEGLPSKLIAYELGISTRTAEHHRSAVMKKMQARTLSHLMRMALDLRAYDVG